MRKPASSGPSSTPHVGPRCHSYRCLGLLFLYWDVKQLGGFALGAFSAVVASSRPLLWLLYASTFKLSTLMPAVLPSS